MESGRRIVFIGNDFRGSREYLRSIIDQMHVCGVRDETIQRLVDAGIGDDSKFLMVRDFAFSLKEVSTLRDFAFFMNKENWNAIIVLWVTQNPSVFSFFEAMEIRKAMVNNLIRTLHEWI